MTTDTRHTASLLSLLPSPPPLLSCPSRPLGPGCISNPSPNPNQTAHSAHSAHTAHTAHTALNCSPCATAHFATTLPRTPPCQNFHTAENTSHSAHCFFAPRLLYLLALPPARTSRSAKSMHLAHSALNCSHCPLPLLLQVSWQSSWQPWAWRKLASASQTWARQRQQVRVK